MVKTPKSIRISQKFFYWRLRSGWKLIDTCHLTQPWLTNPFFFMSVFWPRPVFFLLLFFSFHTAYYQTFYHTQCYVRISLVFFYWNWTKWKNGKMEKCKNWKMEKRLLRPRPISNYPNIFFSAKYIKWLLKRNETDFDHDDDSKTV